MMQVSGLLRPLPWRRLLPLPHPAAPLLVRGRAPVHPPLAASGSKPLVALRVARPSAVPLLATQVAQSSAPLTPSLLSIGLLAVVYTATVPTGSAGAPAPTLLMRWPGGRPHATGQHPAGAADPL